eukprot:13227719-Alexandrium_andersonii.AAC.2
MVGPVDGTEVILKCDVLNADRALREHEAEDELCSFNTKSPFERLLVVEHLWEVPRNLLGVAPLGHAVDAWWGRLETDPKCGS